MRLQLAFCWILNTGRLYGNLWNHYFQRGLKMEYRNFFENQEKLKFIDIGANLTDPMYKGIYHNSQKHKPDLERVLDRAKKIGVSKIIVTAGCLQEIIDALDICKNYGGNFLYTTVGVHPTRCGEFVKSPYSLSDVEYLDKLDELISQNLDRVVAIGELGLDYDRLKFCSKDIQKKYFEFQLKLAEKYKMPLFLHMRNASQDTFEILERNRDLWSPGGGVCHSYTGDTESLSWLLENDFYIGINGCSLKTDFNLNTLKKIPLNRLLLETDCPWCGIKSTHSSSSYVKSIFKSIKKPENMKEDTILSSRNEPCHILNVAEVVHELNSPDIEFSEFCDRWVLFSGGNNNL